MKKTISNPNPNFSKKNQILERKVDACPSRNDVRTADTANNLPASNRISTVVATPVTRKRAQENIDPPHLKKAKVERPQLNTIQSLILNYLET
jgi:hypothetical protein